MDNIPRFRFHSEMILIQDIQDAVRKTRRPRFGCGRKAVRFIVALQLGQSHELFRAAPHPVMLPTIGRRADPVRAITCNYALQSHVSGYVSIWVCLKIWYIPNYSHLMGIVIINHWV